LLPDVARSRAAVARFWREARAAAKIKNEHVVRIIDVCSTGLGSAVKDRNHHRIMK